MRKDLGFLGDPSTYRLFLLALIVLLAIGCFREGRRALRNIELSKWRMR